MFAETLIKWILLLAGITYGVAGFAQTGPEKILLETDSLASNYPQTLVYLQPDKGIYEIGEDIWFKGYIMDSRLLVPAYRDTTLYVLLLTADGSKIVLEEKVVINNGFASGHLYVRNTLEPGDYLLAACTSGSFPGNSGEFKAFRKLKIRSKKVNARFSLSEKTSPLTLEFFPEGGNLVAGLKNTVAFKATGADGRPADIKGTLYEENSPLADIGTLHQGIGKFVFSPDPGKSYFVKVAGIDSLYPLSEIHREGLTLRLLNNTAKQVSFMAAKTKGVPYEKIVISAQVRGVVYALYQGKMKNDSVYFSLPAHKFPQGIVEVTLYNEALEPLAERLVYVNPQHRLTIHTQLSRPAYEGKDKVKLQIKVTGTNHEPVVAHLGISVYDRFYKNPEDNLTILSYTHLHSQIRGTIADPDQYFNEENENRARDLDLLLMTQGWRKYVWRTEELRKSVKYPAVLTDRVNGNVKNKKHQPLFLVLFTAEKTDVFNPVPVFPDGHFSLSPENMLLGDMYIRPLGDEEVRKKARLLLADNFKVIREILPDKQFLFPLFPEPKETPEYRSLFSGSIALNELVIKGRGKNFSDRYMAGLDSLAAELNPDFVCTRAGILNCENCGHGVKPVEGQTYKKRVRSGSENFIQVKYTAPHYTEEELMSLFNIYKAKGYQREKVFYQPDYEAVPQEKAFGDTRNTLLWNPAVITDKNGEAFIEFFCSDITGKFIGRIEGLDALGRVGAAEFSFTVTGPK